MEDLDADIFGLSEDEDLDDLKMIESEEDEGINPNKSSHLQNS